MGGRKGPSFEIVGVVTNGRTGDLTRQPNRKCISRCGRTPAFSKDLIVRTPADPRAIMSAVQRELRAVDPTVAIENMRTLDDVAASRWRRGSSRCGCWSVSPRSASVLTLVGIYGVLSLSVAARRREIAIRAAVGAGRRDIRRLVLGEASRLIAGGIAAGIVAAVLLSRVLQSFLFEVSPADPLTLRGHGPAVCDRGAPGVLDADAPRRRVDPLEALRCE
jgi:putative ABC transport system permease protein